MISNIPIFYITPDPVKGVGFEKVIKDYHIVCFDDSPLIDILKEREFNVFSLEREIGKQPGFVRNTGKMLENRKVQEYIKINSGKKAGIMFFKPSFKTDIICKSKGYIKIGNDAELNRKFEDKLEFFKLCLENKWPIPRGIIAKVSKMSFSKLKSVLGIPFVIQFGRGWAGGTTFFIRSKDEWKNISDKWPEKEAKFSEMIFGPTYLNNACVTKDGVLVSSPAVQLPGNGKEKVNDGVTFGRQWPSGLKGTQVETIDKLTKEVGIIMRNSGYRGWFGLDFIYDRKKDRIFLSEDNARLTASTNFYTQAERRLGVKMTMFEEHVLQFLGYDEDSRWERTEPNSCQFVFRNFSKKTVMVSKTISSGIYSNRDLVFLRPGIGVSDLRTENEVFLSVPKKDEVINPEIEMYTVESLKSCLDLNGGYKRWFLNMLGFIKSSLSYKEVS